MVYIIPGKRIKPVDLSNKHFGANDVVWRNSDNTWSINGKRMYVKSSSQSDATDYNTTAWSHPTIHFPSSMCMVLRRRYADGSNSTSYVTVNFAKKIIKVVNNESGMEIWVEKDSNVAVDILSGTDSSDASYWKITGTNKIIIFRDVNTSTDSNTNIFGFNNYEPYASERKIKWNIKYDGTNVVTVYVGPTGSVTHTFYANHNTSNHNFYLSVNDYTSANENMYSLGRGRIAIYSRGAYYPLFIGIVRHFPEFEYFQDIYLYSDGAGTTYIPMYYNIYREWWFDDTYFYSFNDVYGYHINDVLKTQITTIGKLKATSSTVELWNQYVYRGKDSSNQLVSNAATGNAPSWSFRYHSPKVTNDVKIWNRTTNSWESKTATADYSWWYPNYIALYRNSASGSYCQLYQILKCSMMHNFEGCVGVSTNSPSPMTVQPRYNWLHVSYNQICAVSFYGKRQSTDFSEPTISDVTFVTNPFDVLERQDEPKSYSDGWILFDNDMNTILRATRNEGVIEGLVVAEAPYVGMDVAVTPGKAIVNGRLYISDDTQYVSIDAADTSPRKDLVVLYDDGTIDVVKGTAESASPSDKTGPETTAPKPPNVPYNAIPLAEVWVAANTTSIGASDITDRRFGVNIFEKAFDFSAPEASVSASTTETKRRIRVPADTYVVELGCHARTSASVQSSKDDLCFVQLYNETDSALLKEIDAAEFDAQQGLLNIFGPWDEPKTLALRYKNEDTSAQNIEGGFVLALIPKAM